MLGVLRSCCGTPSPSGGKDPTVPWAQQLPWDPRWAQTKAPGASAPAALGTWLIGSICWVVLGITNRIIQKAKPQKGIGLQPGSQKPLVWRPPTPLNLLEKTQFNQNKQRAQPCALMLSQQTTDQRGSTRHRCWQTPSLGLSHACGIAAAPAVRPCRAAPESCRPLLLRGFIQPAKPYASKLPGARRPWEWCRPPATAREQGRASPGLPRSG